MCPNRLPGYLALLPFVRGTLLTRPKDHPGRWLGAMGLSPYKYRNNLPPKEQKATCPHVQARHEELLHIGGLPEDLAPKAQ